MLTYDVIKHWSNARLCQSRISKSNNRLKAAIENALLLFNITEFLVLNFNCFFSFTDRQLITVKVP